MANFPQLGFAPIDGNLTKARKYTIASGDTFGGVANGLAPGEVVKPATGGLVTLAASTDTTILGVVAAVTYKDATGVRVYGGYVPAGTTYTGDADVLNPNAIYVWVWDDPDTEYVAPIVTASATSLTNFQIIGKNLALSGVVAAQCDTVYRRSNRSLLFSSAGTATNPFRITDIVRSPGQDYGANFLQAKCKIDAGVNPFFTATGV